MAREPTFCPEIEKWMVHVKNHEWRLEKKEFTLQKVASDLAMMAVNQQKHIVIKPSKSALSVLRRFDDLFYEP